MIQKTTTSEKMSKTLYQIVSEIYDQCELTEDQHFVWKGKGSDVSNILKVTFEGKQHRVSKLLYAFEIGKHPSQISPLRKACNEPNCVEPSHFIEKKKESEGSIDGNGWSESQRKQVRGSLGLLDISNDFQGCVEKKSTRVGGYSSVSIQGKTELSHRAALRLQIGRPIRENMQASHICGNASCVNLNHLAEETAVENMQWKQRHGTTGRKLTAEQHEQIREELKANMSVKQVSEKYKISKKTVNYILYGRHATEKIRRSSFQFTKAMHIEIEQILKSECIYITDANGLQHLVPHREHSRRFGYCRRVFHSQETHYHMLALIWKLKMTRFPNRKMDEFALHNCKEKDCCLPEHLRLGTHEQNMQQKKTDGTHRNHASLSDDVIRQIRVAIGTYPQIAKQFHTTVSIVGKIKREVSHMDVD